MFQEYIWMKRSSGVSSQDLTDHTEDSVSTMQGVRSPHAVQKALRPERGLRESLSENK